MYLAEKPELCCGCGGCVSICPQGAVQLQSAPDGFRYPQIDQTKCSSCGLCEQICAFRKPFQEKEVEQEAYAVVLKDESRLKFCASGGAFSAIAQWIIEKGGMVYGCAWGENMKPVHIGIDSLHDLWRLQGSKYVQSDMGYIYKEVKKQLAMGKYVLFSGTPCQCDALRSYLGREYAQLYCVELICHGVPNFGYFEDFVRYMEKKLHGRILDIRFRDKKLGWGALLKIVFLNRRGKEKNIYLKPEECYYYYFFFYRSLFFREACYQCKYANALRISDFTIGDFWGVQRYCPEIDAEKGVSALIVSSEKAKNALSELSHYMDMRRSSLENIAEENGQLFRPAAKDSAYHTLWQIYQKMGPEGFARKYFMENWKLVLLGYMKRVVPTPVKKAYKSQIKSPKC